MPLAAEVQGLLLTPAGGPGDGWVGFGLTNRNGFRLDVQSLTFEITVADRINDVVGVIREKMVLHKFQRLEGGVYGSYVHHDGTVGVLLECKGGAANDGAHS